MEVESRKNGEGWDLPGAPRSPLLLSYEEEKGMI
jgi:hypothetical protein